MIKTTKSITIKHEGVDLILRYSRNSIRKMDASGFVFRAEKATVSMYTQLICGAFYEACPRSSDDDILDIYLATIPEEHRNDFIAALVDMYVEILQQFIGTGEANTKKIAPPWKKSW